MSPLLVVFVILGYFLVLILISLKTSRNKGSEAFFTANRQSPWYVVAFGMIGASLSGVTFISVPGMVEAVQFSYMQMVLGYMLGYFVIATVLMPLYYRLKLISIYSYLESRFGFWSYKTGAFYFLLSRVIGASFRLFVVAGVLQLAIFDVWGVPYWVSVLVTIGLIYIYTFRGGMNTIIWTDTLQTFFMLTAVILTVYLVSKEFGWSTSETINTIQSSDYSQVFFWDWKDSKNFFKQFFAGAFIAIVMTGLDQDMMQKNLTCRNIGEAQKNMFWFSASLIFVNMLFLGLGALLYIYVNTHGIALPERADDLFPTLALNNFPPLAGVIFILGITAAAYSSADSALTALTTSFCVDFLGFKPGIKDDSKTRIRIHLGFSMILFIVVMIFRYLIDESVISTLFTVAGYTYGPLLGLYAFGLYTKKAIKDKWVPLVCVISPALTYVLQLKAPDWLWGYEIGHELLIFNGLFTFIGLFLISEMNKK